MTNGENINVHRSATGIGPFRYTCEPDSNLIATITGPADTVTNTRESTCNAFAF